MAKFSGMTSMSRVSLTASAAALAMGLASPAFAQDAADEDDKDINEIVVTAQFREQNLQDTPLAITAVTAAIMEARSQTNLAQVADSAPNVTLKPQGASFGPSITASIRGVGQNDFNPAFEPGVGIYIDDVYYPQLTGAVFDLLDLDRVEVLRGPQGTLSGRNSEGGAIKMFSKKPTGDGSGMVEATFGSGRRIGVRGGADFKLAENLFARISGVYKRQDGYVDQLDYGCVFPAGGTATYTANDGSTQLRNPAGGVPRVQPVGECRIGKLGGVGYGAVRGVIRYNPSDDFDLILSADYTHDEHTIAGEVLTGTNIVNSINTNVNGVVHDNKYICGRYCNFATLSQPASSFFGIFAGIIPGTTPQALLATSGSNQSKYDGYNLSANLHVGLTDNISIDNILAYQNFEAEFFTDDDLSPTPLNLGQNRLNHWNWSEELRLNVELGDTIDIVLGGYYFKQRTAYWSYQDIRYIGAGTGAYGPPGIGVFPLQFIQPDYTPAESKAGFANVGWEIAPGLNLNAGVRYTEESKEYHYFRLFPNGTVNPYLDLLGATYGIGYSGPDTLDIFPNALNVAFGNGNTTEIVTALSGSVARYKGSKWDYRAALDYRVSPELMFYASVATGFKGGGTNPRPFNAGQVISFGPEKLTSYEVGFKSDLWDRKLRLNATLFQSDISGLQVPVLACPDAPCAARLNAGDGRTRGFEAELLLRPVEGFTIDASLSHLDFKYKSLAANAIYPANRAGVALSDPAGGVPEWKWSFGAQYEIPMGSVGSLTPRIDAFYQDALYTGPVVTGAPRAAPTVPSANEVRSLNFIPSYTIVNARLTWHNPDKDISVALEVTNLTDKYYFLTNFNLTGLGAGFNKSQPGRPREWAVTVKKKF